MKHIPTPDVVSPITPAIAYCGGKRLLAKRLCQRIEAIPHTSYIEPFCGMGGVFLRRRFRPAAEVINDFSCDVANFFRVARRHPEPLIDQLRFQLSCRTEFDTLLAMPPDTLTDIERAARFFYLQRNCYGGRVTHRAFGVRPGPYPGRFSSSAMQRYIRAIHARLERGVIECLPYSDVLRRYDHPQALFYLDPPYWGSEGTYGKQLFERADFRRLADSLTKLRGRFILSINDEPEIRELFGHFQIAEINTAYSVRRKRSKRVLELIISN